MLLTLRRRDKPGLPAAMPQPGANAEVQITYLKWVHGFRERLHLWHIKLCFAEQYAWSLQCRRSSSRSDRYRGIEIDQTSKNWLIAPNLVRVLKTLCTANCSHANATQGSLHDGALNTSNVSKQNHFTGIKTHIHGCGLHAHYLSPVNSVAKYVLFPAAVVEQIVVACMWVSTIARPRPWYALWCRCSQPVASVQAVSVVQLGRKLKASLLSRGLDSQRPFSSPCESHGSLAE